MKDFQFTKGKKALIIVAHPDDEIIWMGGTILTHPELDWTVFSLCRSTDQDREPKFRRVCARLGAKAIISDLDDNDILDLVDATREAERLILENIKDVAIDILFTHGKNGEYGHERHVAVHDAVNNLIKSKKLKPGAVFYFNYKKNRPKQNPLIISLKNSDIEINLAKKIFLEKKKIVAEMYGYPHDGIDVGLCTNPEAFRLRI